MTPDDIRKIVQDEISKASQKGQFGFGKTPKHFHNGIDSPNLQPESINGFKSLPASGVLTLDADQIVSGPPTNTGANNRQIPKIVVYPIPIIYYLDAPPDPPTTFAGGDAPPGTALLFVGPDVTTTQLWIKTELALAGAEWIGFTADSTITP